jgi:hypothetical protein
VIGDFHHFTTARRTLCKDSPHKFDAVFLVHFLLLLSPRYLIVRDMNLHSACPGHNKKPLLRLGFEPLT